MWPDSQNDYHYMSTAYPVDCNGSHQYTQHCVHPQSSTDEGHCYQSSYPCYPLPSSESTYYTAPGYHCSLHCPYYQDQHQQQQNDTWADGTIVAPLFAGACDMDCRKRDWHGPSDAAAMDGAKACKIPKIDEDPKKPPCKIEQAVKSRIFKEIEQECEHLLKQSECTQCTIKSDNGRENTIPISDLVDIVLETVESIKEERDTQANSDDKKILSKRREQNNTAAIRYREKQRARWEQLLANKQLEEERNIRLKIEVKRLEGEVADMKKALLGY